jgi:hypothetical protein
MRVTAASSLHVLLALSGAVTCVLGLKGWTSNGGIEFSPQLAVAESTGAPGEFQFSLRLVNRSRKAVEIESLKKTCGCTTVRADRMTVEPSGYCIVSGVVENRKSVDRPVKVGVTAVVLVNGQKKHIGAIVICGKE